MVKRPVALTEWEIVAAGKLEHLRQGGCTIGMLIPVVELILADLSPLPAPTTPAIQRPSGPRTGCRVPLPSVPAEYHRIQRRRIHEAG